MSAPAWRVGAATTPFPVPEGVPLGGYMARTGTATGTHDALQIGALMLTCGERRLVILTADVVAVDQSLVDHVRHGARLADGELLVCASHTHSGPAGIVERLHPAWAPAGDEAMRNRFVELAAMCIHAAGKQTEPAALAIAAAEPETAVWTNRNDPDGPVDRRITTLVARREDGSIVAALLHFACHPTVLGHENVLTSADLAGAARRALLDQLGNPALPILFANGAAGDISTRFTRRESTFRACDRLGALAAHAAHEAIQAAVAAAPIPPSLTHAQSTCALIRARSRAMDAGRTAPRERATQDTPKGRGEETRRQGTELSWRGAGAPWPTTVPLDAWCLGGEVALLAIPGELTTVPAQLIETTSPFPVTRICGYANDYAGYLPGLALYHAGTYEALASPYAPGSGERIAQTSGSLLASIA